VNQFEIAKWFWGRHRAQILAGPKDEWVIDPYAWGEFIRMTPIEEWLWADIRQTNSVFYPQWPEAGFFLDFANPRAKVCIECDGKEFHKDKEKDERRDAKLRDLGWSVYRFPGWLCRTESDEETGEPGEAYQILDRISRRHRIRRDGKRLDVTLLDGMKALLTDIMAANGYDSDGEPA
jgi:very-short-patch-repair endonuclease